MPRKILVSFGDSRLRPTGSRLARQARATGWYDRIIVADERWLARDFRARYRDRLVFGSPGFGFWVWKPQVILQAMELVEPGDLVHYVDIGCHLNPHGAARLQVYFATALTSETGVMAFYAGPPGALHEYGPGRPVSPVRDGLWCKGDLLDHLAVRERPDIIDTPIVEAGHVVVRVGAEARDVIAAWAAVPAADFSLIDDTPSRAPNPEGFVQHRHDQSIFSILCKMRSVSLLPCEHYPTVLTPAGDPDWDTLADKPVHARRDRQYTAWVRLGHVARQWGERAARMGRRLAASRPAPRPGTREST